MENEIRETFKCVYFPYVRSRAGFDTWQVANYMEIYNPLSEFVEVELHNETN